MVIRVLYDCLHAERVRRKDKPEELQQLDNSP